MAATDTITPALNEMLKKKAQDVLGAIYGSAERRRVIGGKSARLLRRGDTVALRDLRLDRADVPGLRTVSDASTSESGMTSVLTVQQDVLQIPASRLVCVCRIVD